jgi:hypothetical protein
MAALTQIAALFLTERLTVQPEARSVMVRVKQNSPNEFRGVVAYRIDLDEAGSGLVPLRPGPNGIWDLRSEPGLVWLWLRSPARILAPRSPGSMAAALISMSNATVRARARHGPDASR